MGIKFNRVVFERWVDQSGVNNATRAAIFELLDFALDKSDGRPGADILEGGEDNKTFQYRVRTGRTSFELLFNCHCSGCVGMYLGIPSLTDTQVSSFLNNFRSNKAFEYVMRYEDPRNRNDQGCQLFSIEKALVEDPAFMEKFKKAVGKLKVDIHRRGQKRLR